MTSRTLVLLRHAKADRPDGVGDLERPLTERGHADAAAAGAWLAHHGYAPELVICSPARRTRQTWHGVAVAMAEAAADASAPTVRYEPGLYAEGHPALLALAKAVPAEIATVLLVGHNPDISLLSAMLDPDSADDSDGMRTCGLAVHRFDGDWASLGTGGAPLADSHTARG
ncbi:SixA phosphatase family protein [Catenuloplanes atrovinosus]|uniref:Phosphohistidine phosphatase n=1 Tax=Catenuloplanes atrovinosus TaxID=137266 RepID=A0AAE4CD02_9ACTN|nr:histidine phosphatase family protein [Catenuloplanes atrovinosus]MDR7280136.1 phosphohistidine phosphatase [Catenuloplanes atrovinosus]